MTLRHAHHLTAVRGPAEFRLTVTGAERLTSGLIDAVESVCARVEDAPGSPVVVLRLGMPRAAGETGRPPNAPAAIGLVSRWERSLRRLERAGAGVFAVAGGWCGGTALEALLSCDYRVAAPDLRLAPLAASGEPWPGMVVHRLTAQLGAARARRLALHDGWVSGPRALEAGLVDEISDDTARALASAIALARRLDGSPSAVRRRILLEATASSGFEEAFGIRPAAGARPPGLRPGPALP
ncbi:enoyl-CoA-hydratase DpgB [Streptomyces sp. NPDC020141]|uniref:enoyl-CoA-hydratase DpgB n=1 Tax=Streptomyces sp. NPDC020141 TaxID=3365065 RepID=UPI0037963C98